MKYRNPIITDSGGFQVFSLLYGSVAEELKSKGKKRNGEGGVLKISEDGVLFRNYRDGSKMLFTPETSVDHQKALGADLIIPFDELPPYHCDPDHLLASLERTHRWELRSLARHLSLPNDQAMYAVVHGGTDPKLREQSAVALRAHPFDGFALGGSFGKTDTDLQGVVKHTMPFLPTERPVHLLGIAHESGIDACVPFGVDTFDSCYPARVARHGTLLTKRCIV
jgi:queuine tRNA-ribosyltransferase